MAAQFERDGGILTGHAGGRLDAFEADELYRQIRGALHDDDCGLIIDLAGCHYLSSGGIRTFVACQKEMARRHGGFALAGVPDYPMKVLRMAGFTSVFQIFPSAGAARESLVKSVAGRDGLASPPGHGAATDSVSFFAGDGNEAASLHIIGDLNNVLNSRITEKDIRLCRFSEIEYSLGLGALGASVADAMPLLGEMITLHGPMVWLPTDGHTTPVFYTAGP